MTKQRLLKRLFLFVDHRTRYFLVFINNTIRSCKEKIINCSRLFLTTISRIVNWFLPGCRPIQLFYSSLHSMWMIFFCIIWLTHINTFDGFDFMKDAGGYRDYIVQDIFHCKKETDISKKYLLINTSRNNQLLFEDNDKQINSVIVDRKQLCRVLNILDSNESKIKYIICDIFLESPDGIYDSSLSRVIDRLTKKKKIIIPYFLGDENEQEMSFPFIKSACGLSQYKSSFLNSQFLKFSYIVKDTLKQVPLIVYEQLSGNLMVKHRVLTIPYYFIGNNWCLNTIIPEFRYTSSDLIQDETYYDLGFFTKDFISTDQVVVIGDFTGVKDKHHSIMNQVPGVLILMNAIESLYHRDNIIHLSYLAFLFLFFLIISYHTLYKKRIEEYFAYRKKSNILVVILRNWINDLLILIMSLISMLYFHHYIHLFILLGYFSFIEVLLWLRHKLWGLR